MLFIISSFIVPHPRPLPKNGGEVCSNQSNTMINSVMNYWQPSPFPFWGRGPGGRGKKGEVSRGDGA
jgi:hypothetical protein